MPMPGASDSRPVSPSPQNADCITAVRRSKGFRGINRSLRSLFIPRSLSACPYVTQHGKGDELTGRAATPKQATAVVDSENPRRGLGIFSPGQQEKPIF